ncbi:MAG: hypothetical protein MUC50_07750 [Myxococcota bacterium]|jgi:hypothetical protein|nr:hypothetical protein [Myxococcota bacterium]
MMHLPQVPLIALLASVLALGCAAAGFKVGEPFAAGEGRFFDDGIDLIENLETLSGEWGYQAQDDLSGRVQLADFVAVVDILAVQLSQDVDGKESRRIDLQIKEPLLGKSPGMTLSMSASEESSGFATILRNEQRLTGSKIVFVRFFLDDAGGVRSHFHLSPDSPALRANVKKLIVARHREENAARAGTKGR